ncbi:MAG: efflux RND transporter periplasmic adaptor subunit [Pseudomonadaceae bacterium]|nr:efflux RND transporter periplasmic adaptor subunit [Pseudomonadaceae bacterium]
MKAYAVVILILLVLFGSIGAYLFQRFAAFGAMDFAPPPVTVAVSTARAEVWDQTLSAVGTVRAVRGIDLTSETSGEITDIAFESGQKVEAGQLLLVLNDKVEQASLASQAASLELAEILFERDSTLIEKRSIPQTQFDRSRADLARARAQLAETQARLANKRIEAPFAGTMGLRRVDVGDYLAPGTVIATLQDLSSLEIDFTVPARFVPSLRAGLTLAVRIDGFADREFSAEVTALDARIDANTRNVLMRARLTETEGLLPGMFAQLELDLGEEKAVTTIPETAMTYALQGNTVYVLEALDDGSLTATPRIVVSGAVRDGRVAVLSGLEADERVVSVGQNKLYRGVRVVIDPDVVL